MNEIEKSKCRDCDANKNQYTNKEPICKSVEPCNWYMHSPVLGETVKLTRQEIIQAEEWNVADIGGEDVLVLYAVPIVEAQCRKVAEALGNIGGYQQGENGLVVDKNKWSKLIAELEEGK